MKALFLFLVLSIFPLGAIFASEGLPTVVETAGKAEILNTAGEWAPLKKSDTLALNSRIRTDWDSFIRVAFNNEMESAFELRENSRLAFLNGEVAELSLEKGSLFVLREEKKPDSKSVRITADNASILMRLGGCFVRLLKEGGFLIQVFSERASVRTETKSMEVEEGFVWSGNRSHYSLKRMHYPDYAYWQTWVRGWYENKDDAKRNLV